MKKVAVIPNVKKDKELTLTKKIIEALTNMGARAILPSELEGELTAEFMPIKELFESVDFVVTVGGDGTILRIAELLSRNNLAVIGVNLGRMGFLAELEPEEITLLENIINDNYKIEKRMMLEVSVLRNTKEIDTYKALNDIVVSKGAISKISELELYCNDTFVSHFNSDGLIVSTPTGSTAYSLSAGGAIIDPTINCMLLTPVCPHSFNNSRPIVFSPESVLKIRDVQDGEQNIYLTVDGKINVELEYGDVVEIRASDTTTNLIKLKNEEFYKRVYQKIAERK